jgi:hypothetical protein
MGSLALPRGFEYWQLVLIVVAIIFFIVTLYIAVTILLSTGSH